MDINVFYGILIPFLGTSAGAACVFFMKKNLNEQIQRALTGFAAGVMVAASIWSLLIPAIAVYSLTAFIPKDIVITVLAVLIAIPIRKGINNAGNR